MDMPRLRGKAGLQQAEQDFTSLFEASEDGCVLRAPCPTDGTVGSVLRGMAKLQQSRHSSNRH
jgi:hypothetical protein